MGFEQGPIRPPSEAGSLLVRVGRNCPWNGCAFCPVYKGREFSKRSVQEIISDVDEIAEAVDLVREESWRRGEGGSPSETLLVGMLRKAHPGSAAQAAALWLLKGEGTVFLQDADPVSMSSEKLEQVLGHVRRRLPGVRRVTAYARSATLAARGPGKLARLREAGLDRVHVGFESGSDRVLDLVSKGVTAEMHVVGGRAAIEAGLELSAYVMPGLGGASLSREHAVESARCIALVEPHFTRLRTLAVVPRAPLAAMVERGEFSPLDDDAVVREIRTFLEGLRGVRTALRSDHILNLLGDLEGDLPTDHGRLLGLVDSYLALAGRDRQVFRLGRRAGLFHGLEDLADPGRRTRAEALLAEVGTTGVDAACRELMEQWV